MSYYEPAEDSELLLSVAKSLRLKDNPLILEVGVGSGYVIGELSNVKDGSYFGSDINPAAIKKTKSRFDELKREISLSSKPFFSGFKEKFDLVLFNAPYLPLEDEEKFEDLSDEDKALYGGKQGYEVIEQWIVSLNDSLSEKGKALLLFSSLSNYKKIKEILDLYLFDYSVVAKEKVFFEEMYCLEISKSDSLQKISRHVTCIKPFSKGKHSRVYVGCYKKKEVIIKLAHEAFIAKEFYFLEKLKEKQFIPNLYEHDKNFVIMQKIEGTTIFDFLESASKKDCIDVLNSVLGCCYHLDIAGITKFEMTNPYKHIIVKENNKVVFIDFERSIFSASPKNTRQFLESIRRHKGLLSSKKIAISEEKIREISIKCKKEKIRVRIEDLLSQ